jgi:hypothetical protein
MKYDDTGGTCSTHDKDETFFHILAGKLEGNRPHGRFRNKCVDNIQMNLKEMGYKYVDSFKWLVTSSVQL